MAHCLSALERVTLSRVARPFSLLLGFRGSRVAQYDGRTQLDRAVRMTVPQTKPAEVPTERAAPPEKQAEPPLVLTVLTEGDYPPFNYRDDAGELTGFDVDLAHALCDRLGAQGRPVGIAFMACNVGAHMHRDDSEKTQCLHHVRRDVRRAFDAAAGKE